MSKYQNERPGAIYQVVSVDRPRGRTRVTTFKAKNANWNKVALTKANNEIRHRNRHPLHFSDTRLVVLRG
jgi:hypothetical protein